MYSFPNFEPVSRSMFSSNCFFLICIQISQEAGKVVWYSHLSKNFPVCCDPQSQTLYLAQSVKQKQMFFWNSLAFSVTQWMLAIWSLSSAFSKSSLYSWNFSIHVLLKFNLEDFEHELASMCNEHSCAVVWTFFGTALLWDWNENWPFPVWWPLLGFPNLLTYWVLCMYVLFILGLPWWLRGEESSC